MKKVRESDIKLNIHNDKLYVEYEAVMKLVERHDLLVDQLRGKSE